MKARQSVGNRVCCPQQRVGVKETALLSSPMRSSRNGVESSWPSEETEVSGNTDR
jgi:hypothetical protein